MIASQPAIGARGTARQGISRPVSALLLLIACVFAGATLPAGQAAAQPEVIYTQPPSPPTGIPDLACETADDRAKFAQLKDDWVAASAKVPGGEQTYEDATKAYSAASDAARQATAAKDAAKVAADRADANFKLGRGTQAAVDQADAALRAAWEAVNKAESNRSAAYKTAMQARDAFDNLTLKIQGLSRKSWRLVADIGERKCGAPQPQAAPQPPPKQPPPPATANHRPQPLAEEPQAPKAKCAACKKVVDEISQIDAKIADLEQFDAKLQTGKSGGLSQTTQDALKADAKKISDLKAKKASLEAQLLKCEQSCAPKAATEGYLANGAGSVLQGNVLSGDVLHGIGATAAPVSQPNRSGDESETGKSEKTGEHGPTDQPPGRSGATNH